MELFDYQKQAIDKIHQLKRCFLFMSCGTGKTFTALNAINGKALILAPPKIVKNKVWEKENKQLKKDITVISMYNKNAINKIDAREYQYCIIDEVHRCKNHTAQISKRINKLSKFIPYVVGLTGTPSSNGYWDIWGMSRSLNIPMFKETAKNSFLTTYYNTFSLPSMPYVLLPNSLKKGTDIFDRIERYAFSYTNEYTDYTENTIYCDEPLSDEYLTAQQGVLGDKTLTALSAVTALRQLANGFYYDNGKAKIVDDAKYSLFNEVYAKLKRQGKKVIVIYTYTADKERIKLVDDDIAIQESAAEGLNLQAYDTIVFYNSTYSYQNYEQARKRILRLGQDKKCTIITLIRKGSIDALVEKKKDKKVSDADLLNEYLKGI